MRTAVRLIRVICLVTCLGGVATRAAGEDSAGAIVEMADGTKFPAQFCGVTGQGGLRFAREDGAAEYQASELFAWGKLAQRWDRGFVVLRIGSLIAAEIVEFTDENAVFESPIFPRLIVPRAELAGFWTVLTANNKGEDELYRWINASRSNSADRADGTASIRLNSGEVIEARRLVLDGANLTASTVLGEVEVPLDRVDAVGFKFNEPAHRPRMAWGLADGSIILAESVVEAGQGSFAAIFAELPTRVDIHIPTSEIVFFQNLAEPFVYLSEISAADYRHVPYFSLKREYGRDRSLTGGMLRAGGQRFLKGLAMPSASRLVYRLDGDAAAFHATVGMDDRTDRRGSVRFHVLCRRDGRWTEDFASESIRGGDECRDVHVDLRGADAMTLVIDDAGDGPILDEALWLNPRVVRRSTN